MKEQQLSPPPTPGFSDGINKFVHITGSWKQLMFKARSHFSLPCIHFPLPRIPEESGKLEVRIHSKKRYSCLRKPSRGPTVQPHTNSQEPVLLNSFLRAVNQSRACIIGCTETRPGGSGFRILRVARHHLFSRAFYRPQMNSTSMKQASSPARVPPLPAPHHVYLPHL